DVRDIAAGVRDRDDRMFIECGFDVRELLQYSLDVPLRFLPLADVTCKHNEEPLFCQRDLAHSHFEGNIRAVLPLTNHFIPSVKITEGSVVMRSSRRRHYQAPDVCTPQLRLCVAEYFLRSRIGRLNYTKLIEGKDSINCRINYGSKTGQTLL